MYKTVGLLFCVLLGFMVAHFGWIALLWTPIGFAVGIYSSSNVILPISMGLPLATNLVLKKEMRPKVFLVIILTPLIWIIVLLILGFLFPSIVNWILINNSFCFGILFGFVTILLSPISKKVRQDFREDFDKSWGRYYTNPTHYNLSYTDYKDKNQLKQIEAAIKISSNLHQHTISIYKDILYFNLPDSNYRYMVFCLSGIIKSCEDLTTSSESLYKECLHFLYNYATLKTNIKEFFTDQVSVETAEISGFNYFNEYIIGWSNYFLAINNNDRKKANEIICTMIHSSETNTPIDNQDIARLSQLASTIESFIPSFRSSFMKLINPKLFNKIL